MSNITSIPRLLRNTGYKQCSSQCVCVLSSRYLSIAESMEATDVLNPALNYGIVVDCGSSGSRVFVYYWPPHNGNPHTLLDIKQMKDRDRKPVVKKIKPGEEVEPSCSCVCHMSEVFNNPGTPTDHYADKAWFLGSLLGTHLSLYILVWMFLLSFMDNCSSFVHCRLFPVHCGNGNVTVFNQESAKPTAANLSFSVHLISGVLII